MSTGKKRKSRGYQLTSESILFSKASLHHSSNLDTSVSEPPAKKRRADVSNGNKTSQGDQQDGIPIDGAAELLPIVQDLSDDAPERSLQAAEPRFQDAQSTIPDQAASNSPSQLGPGLSKAASEILDESAQLQQYAAMGAAAGAALNASKNMAPGKTGSRMRVESLPILDNLVRIILPHI